MDLEAHITKIPENYTPEYCHFVRLGCSSRGWFDSSFFGSHFKHTMLKRAPHRDFLAVCEREPLTSNGKYFLENSFLDIVREHNGYVIYPKPQNGPWVYRIEYASLENEEFWFPIRVQIPVHWEVCDALYVIGSYESKDVFVLRDLDFSNVYVFYRVLKLIRESSKVCK